MIERAVILAVGNPAHHSQIAQNRPRAMFPALGKPLVVRIMNRLHRIGIREYVVVVGVNEGAVASYLNTSWVPNAKVEFVLKSNEDSVTRVLSSVARSYGKPFLVASYNSFTHSYFPESLLRQHEQSERTLILGGAPTTLSSSRQHYFAAQDAERITTISNAKPAEQAAITLTDMAACGQDFVDYLANVQVRTGTFHHQLMDIITQYVNADGAAQLAETAWILQVETDHDLLTLNKLLLDEGQDNHILSELPYTVQVIPPVRIDPQVSVGQGAKIGPHVYLERGCIVGHEALVQNAIILQQAKVPPKATVSGAIMTSHGRVT